MTPIKQAKINFPAKQSLGSLYLAERAFPHQRQWIGDAKGPMSLSIPENKNLGIALGQLGSGGLTSLSPEETHLFSSLDFSASYFNDKTVQSAAGLGVSMPNLNELRLDFLKVGASEMESLRYFSGLKTLWLTGTDLTDEGLDPLGSLGGLVHLILKKTRITDSGINKLKNLSALETLNLPSQITDDGLKYFADFKNLTRLDISDTAISDYGVKYLVPMESLTEIYLNDTKLTDGVFEHLVQMPTLRTIFLSGTKVTDNGIVHMEKNQKLEHLELRDTSATELGIARLRSKLPACAIFGP
jgi:Leucine-rich repeat (LRR) protein